MKSFPSNEPLVAWPEASAQDLAEFDCLLEQESEEINGVYWRRVRPFFFRPLLPFREYASASIAAPRAARWGGFQHAVPEREPSNTHLNVLLFDNSGDYTVKSLDYNRRRQVRTAAEKLCVLPVRDAGEFKQKAYPVYVSFYDRTRYAHGAHRRDRKYFDRWADALFRSRALVILGGYQDDRLAGVSVSLRVEDTLVYAMFFCDTDSLRLGLSDLMLHTIREAAARDAGIRQIYTGMSNEKNDRFYLLRGGRCVSLRARLVMNPLAEVVLRRSLPGVYARLRGELSAKAAE